MARITFKQFIELNESGEDFISGTMEFEPSKTIEVQDPNYPNDPKRKIKIPNPEYAKEKKAALQNYPASRDTLKVVGSEPEATKFDPREVPEIVKSGGQFKARATDPRRAPYQNDYFFKGQGMFYLPPSSYKPEFMQR